MKQEKNSRSCDPGLKMKGEGLESQVIKPLMSHMQKPSSVFIVWGKKQAQEWLKREKKNGKIPA